MCKFQLTTTNKNMKKWETPQDVYNKVVNQTVPPHYLMPRVFPSKKFSGVIVTPGSWLWGSFSIWEGHILISYRIYWFIRVIAISFSFFGCRREKQHQFWLWHFRRLVYRISIVYAQSLSLRSEELDADTVYSFVPNIGDSDPSSRCTYSKITNGANVDLNYSF